MTKNNMKRVVGVLVLFVLALLVFWFWPLAAVKKVQVRFANAQSIMTALVPIAVEKKFFEKEGVDIRITTFDVGKLAVDSMLSGSNDFAIAAQTPVSVAGFTRSDFKLVGTVSSSINLCKILVRKDRVQKAADLKGKRINATKSTALEHFLSIYLDRNKIEKKDVTISYLDLKTALEKLIKGELDAVVAQEPFVMDTLKKMGDKGMVLEEPGLYSTYGVLCVNQTFQAQKPEAVKRILKAFLDASEFYYKHPEESMRILTNYYHTDKAHIDEQTSEADYQITLRQGFIYSIEIESKEILKDGLLTNQKVPDYLNFIDENILKKLKPANVDIVR